MERGKVSLADATGTKNPLRFSEGKTLRINPGQNPILLVLSVIVKFSHRF